MRRLLHDESGMTLVELVVASAVLLLLMAGLSNMFVSGLRASTTGDARLASQEAVRTAFDRLEYDARCADAAGLLSSGAGVHLTIPDWCANASGDVTWCVSSGALVRVAGTTCAAGETLVTNVTTPTPFSCVTTGQLPQLTVALGVNTSGVASDGTSATDAITLRNAGSASACS